MNKLLLSIKMQFRVPISVFFSLVFPIVMMLTMVLSYGNFSIGGGYHFIDKYFLISISIGVLPVTFISFPIWISESIENQTFKRLKYLNVDIKKLLFSELISYCILTLLSVGLNILIAKLLFDLKIPNFEFLFAFLLQVIYCILPLLLIGAFLAFLVRNSRIILPLGMILLFLSYMMIGVFIQYAELPAALQDISSWLPIKYLANDFYDIWSGQNFWDKDFLILNTGYLCILIIIDSLIYKVKNVR